MFKHEKIKELFSAYLDQELSSNEQRNVENHLEGCASCRKEFNAFHKLQDTLSVWKDEELSLDLEQKIKKSFYTKQHKEVAKMKSKKKLFISSAALATFLVCVVVFFSSGHLRRSVRQEVPDYDSKVQAPVKIEHAFDIGIMNNAASYDNANVYTGGMPLQMRSVLPLVTHWDYVPEDRTMFPKTFNTEEYERIYDNAFHKTIDNPLSTFSIDVDTASYTNMRRFINVQRLPPRDAVRIEEMINYFTYNYKQPEADVPFSITTEISNCPWNSEHDLLLIGLQGKNISREKLPPSNLVFLLDVSGSMNEPNKLPLVKKSLRLLVQSLQSQDRVAIVVYAGAAGVVLDSTPESQKDKIIEALNWLEAGGSTAGGVGIKKAYEIAEENFIPTANNRIILATDGDFNVGISSNAEMVRLIEAEREKGIFLTVLGFGEGNYKDSKLEQIADSGNGNYYYIDSILEAKKVFIRELPSTLFTIAKDVKIQVEFNPGKIKTYRLIGYENRMLKKEEFNDDAKDAGELGAGHSVTALYEIDYVGSTENFSTVDDLKYQKVTVKPSEELLTVKLRYKKPDSSESELISKEVTADLKSKEATDNFVFASSVAEFGLLLRDSEHKDNASYERVLKRAKKAKGADAWGYRAEFMRLVEAAQMLSEVAIKY
jgi:Ca-activated chloride channel homolog